MKISYQWLKRYLDLDASVGELEEVLPLIGFEVDSTERVGLPLLNKVVVGEILSREQHPDADRLGVCEVNIGSGEHLSIVCGASNYKVGDRVPVATVGAKLPGGFFIPTPVGDYNPDWAISFKEGSVKHIYFIAETKGDLSTMKLRGIEDRKIECYGAVNRNGLLRQCEGRSQHI